MRRIVSAEKLLEYQVKDGWEPLCRCLGDPVPGEEVPFPVTNDTESFSQSMAADYMYRLTLFPKRVFVRGSVLGVGAMSVWLAGRD